MKMSFVLMNGHTMGGRGDWNLVLQNSDTPFEVGGLFSQIYWVAVNVFDLICSTIE